MNDVWIATCITNCTTCQLSEEPDGRGGCTPCPAGSYGTLLQGAARCIACPSGTYNALTGQTQCTPCNRGTYNPLLGQTSPDSCLACDAGKSSSNNASSACTACSPGTYAPVPGATHCIDCPAGTYMDGTNATQCAPCPAGTANPLAGRSSIQFCAACVPGTFAVGGATECSPCPAGQRQPSSGASSCLPCSNGTYSVGNALDCEQCGGGLSVREDQTGCARRCVPGTYFSLTACSTCPAGTFNDGRSTSIFACQPCPPGTYSDAPGAPQCAACPAGRSHDGFASTHITDCRCPSGQIATQPLQPDNHACAPCPEGATCTPDRVFPTAAPGFWINPLVDPFLVLPCIPAHACRGGDADAELHQLAILDGRCSATNASACSSVSSSAAALCADGYDGERCAQCADDNFRRHRDCARCPHLGLLIPVTVLALALLAAAAALAVRRLKRAGVALEDVAPYAVTLLLFLQLQAEMSSLSVPWGSVSEALLAVARVADVNVFLAAPECYVGHMSFAARWSTQVVVYALVALAVAGGTVATATTRGRDMWSLMARRLLRTLLLLFLPLARLVLAVYDCRSLPGDLWVLRADASVECWASGDGHEGVVVVASMLLVLLVGVAAALTWEAWTCASAPEKSRLLRAVSWPYRGECWCWELVLVASKLALACAGALLSESGGVQAASLSVVVLLLLRVQQRWRPLGGGGRGGVGGADELLGRLLTLGLITLLCGAFTSSRAWVSESEVLAEDWVKWLADIVTAGAIIYGWAVLAVNAPTSPLLAKDAAQDSAKGATAAAPAATAEEEDAKL